MKTQWLRPALCTTSLVGRLFVFPCCRLRVVSRDGGSCTRARHGIASSKLFDLSGMMIANCGRVQLGATATSSTTTTMTRIAPTPVHCQPLAWTIQWSTLFGHPCAGPLKVIAYYADARPLPEATPALNHPRPRLLADVIRNGHQDGTLNMLETMIQECNDGPAQVFR